MAKESKGMKTIFEKKKGSEIGKAAKKGFNNAISDEGRDFKSVVNTPKSLKKAIKKHKEQKY